MPSQRDPNQQLLGFWAKQELLEIIDRARGDTSRSQWLRNAVLAELKRSGVTIPDSIGAAPDRAGKGGPKRKRGTVGPKPRRQRKPKNIGNSPGVDSIDSGSAKGYELPPVSPYSLNEVSSSMPGEQLSEQELEKLVRREERAAYPAARRNRRTGQRSRTGDEVPEQS